MRRKMHKVINNFAQAARKGCQNILAWLCSDLARPPPAPLLRRQRAGPEPRMHLGDRDGDGSPQPWAAQPPLPAPHPSVSSLAGTQQEGTAMGAGGLPLASLLAGGGPA